ncbi:unnamed protein product [Rotaria sp. Silwood2]|nr:unnamed protein product [Rotaria sp. Silwood2]CAF4306109.1 unnamed protein product [Rotaria sp. Silwood2]
MQLNLVLWADGRASHTFLLASTSQCRLVLIEIDVGHRKNGIQKTIEFICQIKSDKSLENLIQSPDNYLYNHRNNHILLNNFSISY